jgi:hypothetical protein
MPHPYEAIVEAAGFKLVVRFAPERIQLWERDSYELHFSEADGFWSLSETGFDDETEPCGNTLETLSDELAIFMEKRNV